MYETWYKRVFGVADFELKKKMRIQNSGSNMAAKIYECLNISIKLGFEMVDELF